MIELPPNSVSSQPQPSQDIKAAEGKPAPSSLPISATVLQSERVSAQSTSSPPVYRILLQVQTGSSAAPSTAAPAIGKPITQITPELMQALQRGQSQLLQTQASFPLAVNTRLQATLLPHQIAIQQWQPPSEPTVQTIQAQAIRHLIAGQQGYSALLSNVLLLQSLLGKSNTANISSALQNGLQHFLSQLARIHPATNRPDTPFSRDTVQNSGILLENKLIGAIQRHLANTQIPNGSNASATLDKVTSGKATSDKATTLPADAANRLTELKGRFTEQLKNLTQPFIKTSSQNHAAASAQLRTTLEALMQSDIKHTLQRLQQTLESLQSGQTPSKSQTVTASALQTTGTLGQNAQPQPDGIRQNAATNTLVNTEGKAPSNPASQGTPNAPVPDADATKPADASNTRTTSTSSFVYSRGQAPGTASSSTAPFTAGLPKSTASSASIFSPIQNPIQDTLLPPLPGQVIVQPQGRIPASLKGDEMADALADVLLRQVKGALNRLTLHQLASQPVSRESGTPAPLLSFEIPILHGNQASVFQFRIEEDTQTSRDEKQQSVGKRWLVQMAFDIEGLGPMVCQIALTGQRTSVTFWAEWENTLEQTKAHFNYLETVLSEMGLTVNKIQGHLGIPASDKTLLHNQLVDIKT